jgi:hypothetical protein
MIENRSAWGMAMIAHDISDAMERLVDRASRLQPKQSKEGRVAQQAPAINK